MMAACMDDHACGYHWRRLLGKDGGVHVQQASIPRLEPTAACGAQRNDMHRALVTCTCSYQSTPSRHWNQHNNCVACCGSAAVQRPQGVVSHSVWCSNQPNCQQLQQQPCLNCVKTNTAAELSLYKPSVCAVVMGPCLSYSSWPHSISICSTLQVAQLVDQAQTCSAGTIHMVCRLFAPRELSQMILCLSASSLDEIGFQREGLCHRDRLSVLSIQ
jgi:hypothetical protein